MFLLLILCIFMRLGAQAVEYQHIITDEPRNAIHLAVVDPKQVSIILAAAHDTCNSTERVSSMAQRNGALLAINGGFFDFCQKTELRDRLVKILDLFGLNFSNTLPIFALKIQDQWLSLSHKHAGVIGWSENGEKVFFDSVKTVPWAVNFAGQEYSVEDINKPFVAGPTVYTPAFDKKTPRKKSVLEIVVSDDHVISIINGKGGTVIPEDGFIYAITPQYQENKDFSGITIGAQAALVKNFDNDRQDWESAEYLLGSTPLLIKNGEITSTITSGSSTFFTKRHPRTAVGVREDGKWIFMVVDGRQKDSVGMTLMELAQFMLEYDCIYALNLDGGGSSVFIMDGKIVNNPSGREWSFVKSERSISNAVLVLPR